LLGVVGSTPHPSPVSKTSDSDGGRRSAGDGKKRVGFSLHGTFLGTRFFSQVEK